MPRSSPFECCWAKLAPADIRGRIDDDSASEGNFGLSYRTQINGDTPTLIKIGGATQF